MKFTSNTNMIAMTAALASTILASPVELTKRWKDPYNVELREKQFSLYMQPRWALPGTGSKEPTIITYTNTNVTGPFGHLEGWIKLDCKDPNAPMGHHVDGAGSMNLTTKLGHVCSGPGIAADYQGTELSFAGQFIEVEKEFEKGERSRCDKVAETEEHPAMARCIFEIPYERLE